MESRSLFLPINESLMPRPRIEALLREGMDSSFVALVAGPGYGKTHSVAKFAETLPGRLVWLHLQKLDNLPHHFWQSFVEAGRLEAPAFSELFETASFPATAGAMEAFLHFFSKGVYRDEAVTLIVDDFHLLTSNEILTFFEQLIAARIPNITFILCGASRVQLEKMARHSGVSPYTVTMEKLRFDRAEIAALLDNFGAKATEENIDAILQRTEGWPLAVNLLLTQLRFDPSAIDGTRWFDLSLTESLFEREFFSNYAPDVRSLLMKLSLLSGFTAGTLQQVGEGNPRQMLQVLADNLFVLYNGAEETYTFQQMYQEFLLSRAIVLSEGERRGVYSVAADERLARGDTLEALELLVKAGRYGEALTLVAGFTNSGMAPGLSGFLLDLLGALPDNLPEISPRAEYLKATILLNNMEIHTANRMLRDLAARLEEENTGGGHDKILGETYLTLAAVCLIQNRDCFLDYYRKAAGVLRGGSLIKEENQPFVGNNRVFFLEHNTPGEAERMEKVYREAEPYIVQVMNGGGRGVSHLFSAEAAYLTGDFRRAKRHAEAAIRRAAEGEQYDILFNARLILTRIALHKGDFAGVLAPLAATHTDVAERDLARFERLRDTLEGWFYVKMSDFERVAPWLVAGDDNWREHPPIEIGRDRMIYANYLIRKQDFHTLIDYLAPLEQIYRMRGHWCERLHVYIARAIANLNTGNEHAALQNLWMGYEMTHCNHIVTPFIEGAWYMRILADIARRCNTFPFEAAWLDKVYDGATAYMDVLGGMMEQYRQVLQSLAGQGAHSTEAKLLETLVSPPGPTGGRAAVMNVSIPGRIAIGATFL